MSQTLRHKFASETAHLVDDKQDYIAQLVSVIIDSARAASASDIHLTPQKHALVMHWRIDGVLHDVAEYSVEIKANVVARLKVMAELLTYKTDVPQEGRLLESDQQAETRICTFPTLYGEKVVIRLFANAGQYQFLGDLGFPTEIAGSLRQILLETGGIVLISGPAGSGKTTTLYALMRELREQSDNRRSLVSLEDPIETILPGVAQSQMQPQAGFDYRTGLRSLLRQDPDVILVGEIRDQETAQIVFEASLTGHLVLSSFHAGSSAEALNRLLEMNLETYQIRSGLLCVINQRLVRRLCSCAQDIRQKEGFLGLEVGQGKDAFGCEQCSGTGYVGRILLSEMLPVRQSVIADAIETHQTTLAIEEQAVAHGMVNRWAHARQLIEQSMTSPTEIRRILGFLSS